MTRFLYAALVLAVVSFLAAVLVLGLIFGFNPFQFTFVPTISPGMSGTDRTAVVGAIGGLSSAISSVIALVVGAIAVTAVIVSQRSEVHAVEQLKLDIASLAAALVSLRDRSLLYTDPAGVDFELDPFEHEREVLAKLMAGPTGLALYWWSRQTKNAARFSELYPGLAGLVDITTLDGRKLFPAITSAVRDRSNKLLRMISGIQEREFKAMCFPLTHLSEGLRHLGATLESDEVTILSDDMDKANAARFRAPTDRELSQLMALAQTKVGGKSSETIEHFGRAAISGTDEDREIFHKLITQLLGLDLDNLP